MGMRGKDGRSEFFSFGHVMLNLKKSVGNYVESPTKN